MLTQWLRVLGDALPGQNWLTLWVKGPEGLGPAEMGLRARVANPMDSPAMAGPAAHPPSVPAMDQSSEDWQLQSRN